MNDALPPWLDIPWDTMETMIAGKSGIDVPRLHVRNLEDAREFIEGYGYDWENAAHRRELLGEPHVAVTAGAQPLDHPVAIDGRHLGGEHLAETVAGRGIGAGSGGLCARWSGTHRH